MPCKLRKELAETQSWPRFDIVFSWPTGLVHELQSCCHLFRRKDELQVLRMDAFCGAVGLLVPPLRHEQVMKELHDPHPGITLMKALARSLVWWPNIDADLERMVQSC